LTNWDKLAEKIPSGSNAKEGVKLAGGKTYVASMLRAAGTGIEQNFLGNSKADRTLFIGQRY
jgi:hypothetical protein